MSLRTKQDTIPKLLPFNRDYEDRRLLNRILLFGFLGHELVGARQPEFFCRCPGRYPNRPTRRLLIKVKMNSRFYRIQRKASGRVLR
jgi:hypothetical protein